MAFSLKKLLLACFLVTCGVALLSTPLLLRFSVYSERTLPMGYQDVIPLHKHSSTLWCENMTTMSSQTFNAYLYDGAEPNVTEHSVQVSLLLRVYAWPLERHYCATSLFGDLRSLAV